VSLPFIHFLGIFLRFAKLFVANLTLQILFHLINGLLRRKNFFFLFSPFAFELVGVQKEGRELLHATNLTSLCTKALI